MTIRYVDPGGSDAADGSVGAPWKTIQKAASTMAAGDTARIRTGTYAPFVVTRNGLTFEPDSGATVIVEVASSYATAYATGSPKYAVRISGVSSCVIRGIRARNAPNQWGAGFHIDNCHGTGIATEGSRTIRLEDVEADHNHSTGIHVTGSEAIDIIRPVCWKNDTGMEIGSSWGILIEDPVLHDNDQLVDPGRGGNGLLFYRSHDVHVTGTDVGGYGGALIYNNRSNSARFDLDEGGRDGGAFEFYESWDILIQGVRCWANHNVYETGQAGLVARSDGIVLEDCLFYADDPAYPDPLWDARNYGAIVRAQAGGIIRHCTFFGLGQETVLVMAPGTPYAGSVDGFMVENSILFGGGAGTRVFSIAGGWTGLSIDHNLVYNPAGTIGYAQAHPVTGDPLFVDRAGRDFHLATGSPAIGAASDLDDLGVRFGVAPGTPPPDPGDPPEDPGDPPDPVDPDPPSFPPYVPSGPTTVHQWEGTIFFLTDGTAWMGSLAQPGNQATSVIGDDPIDLLSGIEYDVHVEAVLDPADQVVSGGRIDLMTTFGTWATALFGPIPLIGDQILDATITPSGALMGVHMGVSWSAEGHVQKPASLHWYIDGPGYPIVIPPPPPDPGGDLGVFDPGDVFLGDLTDAYDIKIRIELNGTGYGVFAINRYSPQATAELLRPGNFVRVTISQIDPNPIFGFFLESGDFELVSSDERGGEIIHFGGRGGLAYWDRAIWLAESFLQPWWPAYLDTGDPLDPGPPEPEDLGAIAFQPGDYISYGVSGRNVVSETVFHTDRFTAYYDAVGTFHRSGGRTDITLVHLSSGYREGEWMHSSGTGIKRYPKRNIYAFGNSVLMESIDDGDKPGQVIYAMYQEGVAADRPEHPIPGMTIDFTDVEDSAGNPWTVTDALRAVSAELGDDYLSTLVKLIDTGAIDVYMGPDLDMHAYNAYGRDLHGAFGSGNVRFEKGVNIADELVREYSDQPIGTFAEVIGNVEGAIARVPLPDPDSPPREISVRGDTADTGALEALGLAELQARKLHSDALGFAVATPIIGREDPDNGMYLPGPPGSERGNYWIGDLATQHTGTGEQDFNEATIRIAAITISFTPANDMAVVVEMNSSFGGRIASQMGARGGSPSTGTTGGVSSTLSNLYQLASEKDQPDGYPSLNGDGRVDFLEVETSWKFRVRAVSLVDVDLTTAIAGATIGGVVVADGDAVLFAGQADAEENGIRTILTSGIPPRRGDMTVGSDVPGAVVLAVEGDSAGKVFYSTTATAPLIDTDPIEFAELVTSAVSSHLVLVTAYDPAIGAWLPVVDGDGNAVYVEV